MSMLMSWKLWALVGLVAALMVGLYQIRAQAQEIGSLEARNATQKQAIQHLGYELADQRARHQEELAARDAAVEAHRHEAEAARQRAEGLAAQFDNARRADADLDSCLGLLLPRGIADRLRE